MSQPSTPVIDRNRLYTVEEYFALDAASDIRLEYFDGHIVPHPDNASRNSPTAMAGATKAHNRLVGNLRLAIETALRDTDDAREVFSTRVRVQVDSSRKYTYPDLIVTCDDRDDDPLTVRRPAVLVEVLSPTTERYDRSGKFALYRTIPTLDQVILIEPRWVAVDSYTRNPDGATWTLTALRELTDDLVIRSVDARLPLEEVYRRVTLSELRSWD